MKTIVTSRHGEVPNDQRQRAEDILERLAKFAHRPHRAEVVFDSDHHRKIVELQLYIPRGQVHVSTAEADDYRAALTRAAEKMRNQLDKARRPERRTATG